MAELDLSLVKQAVSRLCLQANLEADPEVLSILKQYRGDGLAGRVAEDLLLNAQIAKEDGVPLCQDTGMVVVFIELGQDLHLVGGVLEDAINEGVREAYQAGYLRKSVVKDPLRRENTKDNTPAVIHTKVVPGDQLKLTVSPKGFGSENASALVMLTPAQGREGVIEFILDTVRDKGPNACPPLVLGVGMGGTMEKAALLAKQALTLPLGRPHPDRYYRDLEKEILTRVNQTGVGMQGWGEGPTALAVHILEYPTHIAGLPVALNICCHIYRHRSTILRGKG